MRCPDLEGEPLDLVEQLAHQLSRRRDAHPPGLRRGAPVRIRAGPFTGQLGLFAGMRPRDRVTVLLTLLGAAQRMELAV
jgi:transcription antitermination factor NusG